MTKGETQRKKKKTKNPQPQTRNTTKKNQTTASITSHYFALLKRQVEERQDIAGFLKWHKLSVFQQLNLAFNFS